MSLEKFRRPRLVIQSPKTTVHDAARAMESNRVGVIMVQDHRKLVGIVTDRDLGVRAAGFELDPCTTLLAEVMTADVVTLPVTAEAADAVRVMREHHVRRIPVLDGDRIVGLVTLDDLILDGSVPLHDLAEVVRGQLAEPSALKPRGSTCPTEPVYGTALPAGRKRESTAERLEHRHSARAEEAYGRLLHRVQQATKLDSRERAATALEVVLGMLVRRIIPHEAADLIAQLPCLLKDRLLDLPAGPDRTITREVIERELSQRLDIEPDEGARLLEAVGAVLEQVVSPGEIDHVCDQLPKAMRGIFPSYPA